MLSALKLDEQHEHHRADAVTMLRHLADVLKSGEARVVSMDRAEVLDGLADQIVTAVAAGYNNRMDILEATERVDKSNWSKFDSLGRPLFNEHGKVVKGPGYQPPNLIGLY